MLAPLISMLNRISYSAMKFPNDYHPGPFLRRAFGITCSVCLVTLLSFFPGSTVITDARAATQEIDRILVVVNDDIITESELGEQIKMAKEQIAQQNIEAPSDELIRKQVLERTILERIQLQYAQRAGISISDKDIENTIDRIVEGNKVSKEVFFKNLGEKGTDLPTFKNELRRQLIIQKLVDQRIKRQVSISENEVSQFLETRNRLLGGKDAYELSHIMIPIPESASPAKLQNAKKRAQEIFAKLKGGADFQHTAIAYSSAREALEGGKLGWRSAGQLPDLFVGALANMKPGEISDLLRSPNGFHILKLNDRRSSKKSKTVIQHHTRHILLATNDVLPVSDTLLKIKNIRQQIIDGGDFADLARSYSQDPVSAANGGELNWVNPGEMVPEFDKAMSQLKLNEISQPIRTNYGFHLIQVLERRQQDIGEKLDRADARKQIHARKSDERYQQWIRQLRDEAYIKYVSETDV
ncbi:MAG: peptidylprolyl isomerase [Gammaproteobacteria bacterium]|nr:MAG: peptidylprolyl isomerase [Gammaproteobacteria bacterium]